MGLIDNAMQPQGQPQVQSPQADQQDVPGAPAQDPQVPPQLQQAYQRVIQAAAQVIHHPEVGQYIVGCLKHGESPPQCLADTLLLVMKELYQVSKGTMPKEVIVPVAREVMELLAELAAHAGLFKADPAMLQQAWQLAVQKFMAENKIDPAQVQQVAAQRQGQARPQFQRVLAGQPVQGQQPQQPPVGA